MGWVDMASTQLNADRERDNGDEQRGDCMPSRRRGSHVRDCTGRSMAVAVPQITKIRNVTEFKEHSNLLWH